MNIKGISIWEQHIERIVLGIAGLVAVGFLALQFIGEPNKVEVGGETFTPSEVNSDLEERAESLEGNLQPNSPSPIEISRPETVNDIFVTRLGTKSDGNQLAVALHPAFAIGGGAAVASPDKPYRLVSLPAPENVRVEQYFDGLSASAIEGFPELADRYPDTPYDATWTTAAAVIDMATVRTMLSSPGSDGELPVPEGWYNGKLPVMFVRVEREELVDGEWANQVTLDPIPGQASLLDVIDDDDPSASDRRYIFEYLGDNAVQTDIVQPLFYSTANSSWAAPNPDEQIQETEVYDDEDEDARRIRNLRRQIAKKQTERDRIWNQLEEAGGPLDELPDDEPKGGGGGAGGSGGMSGGSGGGTLNDGSGAADERAKKRRIALTKSLRQADKFLTRLRDRLSNLVGEEIEVAATEETESTMDADRLVIWTHDLDVVPHTTYRYRFSIDVYNPYFGKKLNLIEEQQELAEAITVRSPKSEWSAPMTAQPPLRVFVTAASSEGRGGVGAAEGWARAEVFRFEDGRWWMESFRVGPGDRIGEVKASGERGKTQNVDFRTDWFLLDIFADLDADERAGTRDRSGAAILQSLSSASLTEVREPRREAQSFDRDELQAEVDTADAAVLASE